MNYRNDIDGLRAVAVLLVLMFHFGLGVPGGYIGVDVFFVISGFLITGIIKREIEQGEFTFSGFYARRARRILPALLAVLLASSAAAVFILLPSDLERYAESVVATLLSASNFWFWSQGGYFGANSGMAPLLHTWSLAVEEQFYFLLPVALLLLYRWATRWVGLLLLVACVSTFFASAWFVAARPTEVFYFSPFRAWELLLGSLLAFYRLPGIESNMHRQWISVAALALIVLPAFVYTSETVFPGPAAALPAVGTAMLIWTGATGPTMVSQLLKTRALVFIGLISYSLYLWHWPLLVFAKHAMGENLGLEVRLGIALMTLMLATLSWRFIETPFRSRVRTTARQTWGFSGAAVAALGSMVAAVVFSHGLEARYAPEVVALDRARAREVVRGECINIRGPIDANTVCRIGAKGDPTMLVWGDSYAHAALPGFDSALQRMGVAAWFAAESGCPPLPTSRVSYQGRDNWRCREFNDKVINFVGSQSRLNHVVVAAAWDAYSDEASGYKLQVGSAVDSATSLKQGIEVLAQQLRARGIADLIVVGQVPSHGWSVPHKMLSAQLKGEPIPSLKREDWGKRSAASRRIFQQLSAPPAHLAFIDSAAWFCATGVCRYASDQGQPYYWDGGHINARGARFIAPLLEGALRPLIAGTNSTERQ